MSRGTTLANALLMLKGEIGLALTANVAVAKDQELYTLLDNRQKWLSSEYDWPFLKARVDVVIAAGTGDAIRYQTTPTTINFERPVSLETLWTTFWHPVQFGITGREYNALSSGDGAIPAVQYDPIQRIDWKPGDPSKMEIWPLPATQQTLRFEGQTPLNTLKTAGAYDPTKTLDLDDLCVVLFAAAKYFSSFPKMAITAKAKLDEAVTHFNKIRGAYSQRSMPIVLGGAMERPQKRVVPIIIVAH
jgi:hypothetical protein